MFFSFLYLSTKNNKFNRRRKYKNHCFYIYQHKKKNHIIYRGIMNINLKNIGSKIILLSTLLSVTFITAASTVNLKLLVITSGTAEQDQGLDYIDDILDEMNVPYDVLDATQTELTRDVLVTGNVGNYNGVILTDTFMFYTGEGSTNDSSLTLEEWKTLHQYERDFDVRESVLSGFPASGEFYREAYDLDYGMDLDSVVAGASFSADWQAPVGEGEFYEYVNKQNPLVVNDYALAVQPSGDVNGPVVLPLLKDSVTGKTMISELTYSDGRKVLLSTISNASYLLHSQIINYEFVNYATQGVFLGARQIYLSAHVDDLFNADDLWNPEINANYLDGTAYRNTSDGIRNIVSSQKDFEQENPNFDGFVLDLAFNGGYAVLPTAATSSSETLNSVKDTYIFSTDVNAIRGLRTVAKVQKSRRRDSRALIGFDVKKTSPVSKAILNLTTRKTYSSYFYPGKGKICLMNTTWDRMASWNKKLSRTPWSNNGGDFDNSNCVSYKDRWGKISADISSLVSTWQASDYEEFSLIFVGRNSNLTEIYTMNSRYRSTRPQLNLEYQSSSSSDELTNVIIETKDEFRFLNHTLTHRDMYKSAGATYDVALYEVGENLKVWQAIDLPGFDTASQVLVAGNHSGLEDTVSSNAENPIYTQYPEGLNLDLMDALETLDIKYLASDSSRINQDVEHFIPNTNILLLPRYPTQVYYNVTTPENLTDEYNYIYNESYIERGIDPCTDLGAVCVPKTYKEILKFEADTTVNHMLSFKPWPHYFHISNLMNYEDGNSLQFDWLNAVAKEFNKYINLPVKNLDYFTIGEITKDKLAVKAAAVKGVWDRDSNTVTITADSNVKAFVTGIENGEIYGGQSIIKAEVGIVKTVLNVNRALNQ